MRALGRFVEGLLPVLDSCDAALAHGASEVEPVLTALYGALSKEGLERIDPKGAAFDPAEAEAVVHEPGEGGEQVVAEVLRPATAGGAAGAAARHGQGDRLQPGR